MIDEKQINSISGRIIDIFDEEHLTDFEADIILDTLKLSHILDLVERKMEKREGVKVKIE